MRVFLYKLIRRFCLYEIIAQNYEISNRNSGLSKMYLLKKTEMSNQFKRKGKKSLRQVHPTRYPSFVETIYLFV